MQRGSRRVGSRACVMEVRQRVDVDHRQLVSKILARYSADFGTLRELLQNADDAGADSVSITLHADRPGSDALSKIVVWNSGREFGEADWARVQKIAAGNQDANSVGLFGVGFYSVFAVAEHPEIRSGATYMRFSFEEDCYVTYSGALPSFEKGTAIVLPLNAGSSAVQWSSADDQARMRAMLSSSLMFARSLTTVKLQIVRAAADAPSNMLIFRRDLVPVRTLTHEPAPRPASGPGSGQPLFEVARASKQTPPSLDVSHLTLSIREGTDETGEPGASIEFVQLRAEVDVNKKGGRNADTCKSLQKTLGKPLPDKTRMRLLYPASSSGGGGGGRGSGNGSGRSLHEALQALGCVDEQSRVYIGIGKTEQTCGAGFHVCAQLLPTMERATIDFADRDCAFWNRELLSLAGNLSQDYFLDEERLHSARGIPSFMGMPAKLKVLQKKPPAGGASAAAPAPERAAPEKEERKESVLTPRLAALLRAHTFSTSTPNKQVGALIRDGFLAHQERLCVPSTSGAMPCSHVHTVPSELHGALEFLSELPLIPPGASVAGECECKPFYDMIERQGLIRPLDALKVCDHLAHSVLPHAQLSRLLKWYSRLQRTRVFADAETREQFKSTVRVEVSGGGTRRLAEIALHPLGGIGAPSGLPLPPSVLPHAVCEQLSEAECESSLGLRKMSFAEWWDLIGTHACLEEAPTAPLVLTVVAQHFGTAGNEQDQLLHELRRRRCIPSDDEMLRPEEAYLPSDAIALLRNLRLPVACGLEAVPVSFLSALGVRAQPPVSLVRTRMSELAWGFHELVGYLERRESDGLLTESDWDESEATPSTVDGAAATEYLPTKELRGLQLPTIAWAGEAALTATQRRILLRLGVCERPPLEMLLRTAGEGSSETLRIRALCFLCKHMADFYADEYDNATAAAFVPVSGSPLRARPCECFVEPSPWSSAFPVADSSAIGAEGCAALKLPVRPTIDAVVGVLMASPPSEKAAEKVFEYMQRRADELTDEQWAMLAEHALVPVRTSAGAAGGGPKHSSPRTLFFGSSATRKRYGALLDYCSISSTSSGGKFIARCGVADAPSATALAECVARNCTRAIEALSSNISPYLTVLRELCAGLRLQSPEAQVEARAALGAAPCLIGYHRGRKKWSAVDASGCFVDDNQNFVELFEPLTAPEDEELKSLYTFLGVRAISEAVEVEARAVKLDGGSYTVGEGGAAGGAAAQVAERIRERACLLLHDIDKPDCPLRANLREGMRETLRDQRVAVAEVPAIWSTLRFGGREQVQKDAKACVLRTAPSLLVCVVAKTELRGLLEAVGDALASAMLQPVVKTEKIVFESLLASDLAHLRRKGFNVDRFEEELAFARMQQRERTACVLQAALRGMIVRVSMKVEATQLNELRNSHAATKIQNLARSRAARLQLNMLREAVLSSAALILQSRVRQRAAVQALSLQRTDAIDRVARMRAANLLQGAWQAALRRRERFQAEEDADAHEAKVDRWRAALEFAAVEEEKAALAEVEAKKVRDAARLKRELEANMFTTPLKTAADVAAAEAAEKEVAEAAAAAAEARKAAALAKKAAAHAEPLPVREASAPALAPASAELAHVTLPDGAALHTLLPELSMADVAALDAMDGATRMQSLGNTLYPSVSELLGPNALTSKVVGMLLELPNAEVLTLIHSTEARTIAVYKAVDALPPDMVDSLVVDESLAAADESLAAAAMGAVAPSAPAEQFLAPPPLRPPGGDGVRRHVEEDADSECSWGSEGSRIGAGRRRGGLEEAAEEEAGLGGAEYYPEQPGSDTDGEEDEQTLSLTKPRGGAHGLTPAMVAARGKAQLAIDAAAEEYGVCSQDEESDGGEGEASLGGVVRVAEERGIESGLTEAQQQALWNGGRAADAQTKLAPHAAPAPSSAHAGSYAQALGVPQPPPPHAMQSGATPPDQLDAGPVELHPPTNLEYGDMCNVKYGSDAPSAVGLWQAEAAPHAAAAPPPPRAMGASVHPAAPPEIVGRVVPAADASSQVESASRARFGSSEYYRDGASPTEPLELIAGYESQLAQQRKAESALAQRAETAEVELASAKEQLAALHERLTQTHAHLQGYGKRDSAQQEQLSKQLSTNRRNSDTLFAALRQRVSDAEADVEELFANKDEAEEAKESCAELIEGADEASARLSGLIKQLEAKRRAFDAAVQKHHATSHQLAAKALVSTAAQMREALEANSSGRMPAPARVTELETHIRAWLTHVREQAAAAGVDAGPDASRPVARQTRESSTRGQQPSVNKGGKGGGAPSEAGSQGTRQGGKGEQAASTAATTSTATPGGKGGKGKSGKAEGGKAEGGKGQSGKAEAAKAEAAKAEAAKADAPKGSETLIDVVLVKEKRDTRIGVTLMNERGAPSGAPIVAEIAPPPALAHGQLFVGDVIRSVNEWSAAGHAETTARLKKLQGRVRLKIVRGQ